MSRDVLQLHPINKNTEEVIKACQNTVQVKQNYVDHIPFITLPHSLPMKNLSDKKVVIQQRYKTQDLVYSMA